MVKRCETIDAAKEEAIKLGATFSYECGKKRLIGIVSINNKSKKIAISKHSTDYRVLMNIRENVRNAVKEMRA